jgi:hypothetical protein
MGFETKARLDGVLRASGLMALCQHAPRGVVSSNNTSIYLLFPHLGCCFDSELLRWKDAVGTQYVDGKLPYFHVSSPSLIVITQASVNYTHLNQVFLWFFSFDMLLSSPVLPLIFSCKWRCGQMVDSAM